MKGHLFFLDPAGTVSYKWGRKRDVFFKNSNSNAFIPRHIGVMTGLLNSKRKERERISYDHKTQNLSNVSIGD